MLIDTHVHLDLAEYRDDLPAVLARSRAAGVGSWIVPAVMTSACAGLPALAAAHPGLHYAFGLHPWFLTDDLASDLAQLRQAVQARPAGLVAIGECGLDAKVDIPAERQEAALVAQIRLACEHGLPLILHSRGTHEALLGLLGRHRLPAGGVLHAFSGSRQQGEAFIRLGFALGIGGTITYPRAEKTRKAVAQLPVEWLVLETDGPTMPLAGYQGQRNEPARVADVLTELAALRQCTVENLAPALLATTQRIFPGLRVSAASTFSCINPG